MRNARRKDEPLLEEAPSEDSQLTQLRGLQRPISVAAVMLCGLFGFATVYFLYFASPLLLPIAVAILLSFLLDPLVRGLTHWGLPRPASAILLLLAVALTLFGGGYLLSGPASEFASRLPQGVDRLEGKLRGLSQVADRLQRVTSRVQDAVTPASQQSDAEEEGDSWTPTAVIARGPTLFEAAMGYGQSFGAGTVLAGALLLLLLILDEVFLNKLVRMLPTFSDKKLAVQLMREIESDVSRYLSTITLINIVLGIATGTLLAFIGVPNPALWGTMAALANFIPYLGPLAACCVLALVGLVTFDSLWQASLPALSLLGLNLVEAYLLTPLLVGKRLDLNPVMIYLSITFWGFVWGIPGMIIATPLLVMLKISSDRIVPLSPLAELLSGVNSETSNASAKASPRRASSGHSAVR